jgi:hypothetical protein
MVGVPEIAPELLIANPAGRLPEDTVHVMVPTPPLDWSVAVYAALTMPDGRVVVVMTSLGLMVTVNVCFAAWGGVLESVAVTVKFVTPAAVGVPEMSPEPLRVNPPGRFPVVTLQLMEPVPPEAASEALYAVPAIPSASDVVVMVRATGLIVTLNFCVAESGPPWAPEESVTFTVKVVVAAAVGVPEIVPEPPKERPAGNAEPEANAQVSVPAPPPACKVAL